MYHPNHHFNPYQLIKSNNNNEQLHNVTNVSQNQNVIELTYRKYKIVLIVRHIYNNDISKVII